MDLRQAPRHRGGMEGGRRQTGHGHLRVDIYLDYGEKCALCSVCGTLAPMHDSQEERVWRHLDTMQFTTLIHARPPRCRCERHGVKVIDLPWAEKGSHFTLLFEAFAIEILKCVRSNADAPPKISEAPCGKSAEMLQYRCLIPRLRMSANAYQQVRRLASSALRRGVLQLPQ